MSKMPSFLLKWVSLFFMIAAFSSCGTNDLIVLPKTLEKKELIHRDLDDFDIDGITQWMSNVQGTKSKQGADCYRNYLCQFSAGHSFLYITDLEVKKPVATVSLPSLGTDYHCNNADFSSVFYDDADPFPLLYSSQQGKTARCVLVDRIYYDGDEYKVETIQRIDIPFEIDIPLEYTPDVILDKDNDYLYVYAGNTLPITDFYIYKFRLPKVDEGDMKLEEKDLLSSWVIIGNPSYYKQGGMISNNHLFVCEGVPGKNTDNKLRVVDLGSGSYKLFDLTEIFNAKWEPEDIFMYDNKLFVASSQSGVFQLHQKEPFDE